MIRVMIVSARAEVSEGLNTVLRLAGGLEITHEAANLKSAVRVACAESPDIMLVDLEMPGGEGYEILQQIKRANPSVKLIALTAHDYPLALERAVQAGACRVIVKGQGLAQMVAVIQEAAVRQP